MRGAWLVVLGLLPGCFTKALWKGSSDAPPKAPRLAGEALSDLVLLAPREGERSFAFSVGKPSPRAPKRMGIEMGRGRTCLVLRRPFGCAFAGNDLIEGRTILPAERITIRFAQTRTKKGTRRDPALLCVEGPLPDGFGARVERCDEPPDLPPKESIPVEIRVQLGRGLDTLVSFAAGTQPSDVVSWLGIEGPGDWREALARAEARGSIEPLEPYRVFVRLWRDGAPSCYRLHLADVVLAAGLSFDGARYAWEGLWIGSLELPKEPQGEPLAIPAGLRYTEYEIEESDAIAWRVLLTPVAVAGDLGLAALDSWIESKTGSD